MGKRVRVATGFLVLAVVLGLGPAGCEPEFHDIYCLEQESAKLPVCVARLGGAGLGGGGLGGGPQAGFSGGGGGDPAGAAGSGAGGSPAGGAAGAAPGGAAGAAAVPGGHAGTGDAGAGGTVAGAAGGSGASGFTATGGAGAGGSGGAAGVGGCPPASAMCKAPVEVALGRVHACLRVLDGSTYCWGEGASGQLGSGTTQPALAAPGAPIAGLSSQRIAAGGDSSCAATLSGAVLCWGDDTFGQLGRGAEVLGEARAKPTVVGGLASARSVSVGVSTACAIEAAGSVRCWGDNRAGQLGSGTTLSRTPVLSAFSAEPSPSETAIGVGAFRFCGHKSPSSALCVGGDRFSPELADTDSGFDLIQGVDVVRSVATGAYFGCAVEVADGAVSCWGRGDEGQLGLGTADSTNRRVGGEAVPGLAGVASLAAGTAHVCAVLPNKTVTCWGDCSQGACGNGQPIGTTPTVATPTVVSNLDNVKKVFAGHQATCALLDDATVKCWGAVAGAAPTSVPTALTLP